MTTYTHAKPAGTPTWSDLLTPDVDTARASIMPSSVGTTTSAAPNMAAIPRSLGTRMTVGMSGPPPGVRAQAGCLGPVFRHREH